MLSKSFRACFIDVGGVRRSGWAIRKFEQLPDLTSRPAIFRVLTGAIVGVLLAYLSFVTGDAYMGVSDEIRVVGCCAVAWILGAEAGVLAAVVCSAACAALDAAFAPAMRLTPAMQVLVAAGDMIVLGLIAWMISTARALLRQSARRNAALQREAAARLIIDKQLQTLNDGLATTNAELEHSVQTRDRFLAHMSHEVRSPLNGVLGLLRVLSKTNLSAKQQEFANGATRSAERLLRLVNELLDSGLASPTMLDAESSEFDLSLLVKETLCTFFTVANGKGLNFSATYGEQVPRFVVGPRRAIEQVLNNLVTNAIKFTDAGHVCIQVDGEMRLGGEVELRIKVGDSGRGMSEAEIGQLFDRAGRSDPNDRAQRNGAGLGLGIANRLVVAMGGTLLVKSRVGIGSQFEFRVRLAIDHRPRSFASIEPDSATLGVLVVGEHCGDVIAIEEMLRRKKVWTDHPASLEDAEMLLRDAFATRPYRLVILVGSSSIPNGQFLDCLKTTRVSVITFGLSGAGLRSVVESGCNVVQGFSADNLLALVEESYQQLSLTPLAETIANGGTADTTSSDFAFPTLQSSHARSALVVDDDPIGRIVMRELLSGLGVHCECAHSGAAALRSLARDRFAVVFMDKRMPGMDGNETARRIRLQEIQLGQSPVPIIACSANDSPSDRAAFLASGMNEVLPKPVDLTALENLLDRLQMRRQSTTPGTALTSPSQNLGAVRSTEREQLAELFVTTSVERIGEVMQGVAASDFEAVSLAAHTIKSMAKYMGFEELADVFASIETTSQAATPEVPAEILDKARDLHTRALATLQLAA